MNKEREENKEFHIEKERGSQLDLPKIAAIIVLACWIGNRNPEKSDKKIFKDYKFKRKRFNKEIEELLDLKKIKLERMIALA